jgi:hypothetical protein
VRELENELEEKVLEIRRERDEIAFNAIQHIRNLHQKKIDWPQDLAAALASIVTNEDTTSVLSRLKDENDDIASHQINGTLSVVIVRRQNEEVILSRVQSSVTWRFSVQPLEATVSEKGLIKIAWGPGPEQSVEVNGTSDVWRYIDRNHSTTLARQITDEYEQRLLGYLKRLGELDASLPDWI